MEKDAGTVMEGVWCFIICFGTATAEAPKAPVDTFCQSYRRVVLKKGEVPEVMKLSRGLRDRLQGNELEYMCRCLQWKDKVCRTVSGSTRP